MNSLGIKSKFARIETKSVDRLISQIGGVYMCCFCRSIYGMASAKSQIVKIGGEL
jgi:hypothetical protein